MKRKQLIVVGAAALAALAAAGGAWYVGMLQGMAMMAAPEHVAAADVDPTQWTIPQGEAATRRHIEQGLKAGDIDPVTGLRISNYHDPMVPGKNFDAPAKSPFMDMMLVPRYASAATAAAADASSVSVSPRIQQNLGLRTALVTEGSLAGEVAAVGSVAWNEREQVLLQARAIGYVEKLNVRATLDRVAAGAPVAEIYVPAWVAAQEEYLALAAMKGPDLAPLVDAARQRMRLAGMDERQIAAVVANGKVQARQVLTAPRGGIVTELMLREGATVMPGMTLLRIQGTGTVWAEGQVPESQAAALRPGMRVEATSPGAPGERFEGKVQALLPEVDPATRTRKARMELANPKGQLVPGMFIEMRFAGGPRKVALLVPGDAVIRTGRRTVVMRALDEGRFEPVEVSTGAEMNGQVEIVRGLQAGQRVVLSGQFLIDSEASLRGLEARLNPVQGGAAADRATQGGAAAAAAPTQATHRTDALIQALEGDTVTLDHAPIASLKWPQMVMDFHLPPVAQRPRLAAGDRVQVEFRLQGGDLPQITSIRQAAAGAPSGVGSKAGSGAAR